MENTVEMLVNAYFHLFVEVARLCDIAGPTVGPDEPRAGLSVGPDAPSAGPTAGDLSQETTTHLADTGKCPARYFGLYVTSVRNGSGND
eukprot:12244939-Alexandrium_andersonii.AAC.1